MAEHELEKKIGNNIRFFRKINGYTLKSLANKISIAISTLSSYENGDSSPSLVCAQKIAMELNITVDELLTCDSKKSKEKALV